MTLKLHALFLRPLHVSAKLNWPACPELLRNREDSQVELHRSFKYNHKRLVSVEKTAKNGQVRSVSP